MSELLLCPFCGGEAETLTAESMHGGYLFGIMCNDCRSRGDVYDTEAEAIAAWNSRADYHGYEQAAIEAWESIKAWNSRAERTCRSTTDDNAWCFVCSECGKSFPRSQLHLAHNHGEINYCPRCGRKVES